jgi:hypothetical protein
MQATGEQIRNQVVMQEPNTFNILKNSLISNETIPPHEKNGWKMICENILGLPEYTRR